MYPSSLASRPPTGRSSSCRCAGTPPPSPPTAAWWAPASTARPGPLARSRHEARARRGRRGARGRHAGRWCGGGRRPSDPRGRGRLPRADRHPVEDPRGPPHLPLAGRGVRDGAPAGRALVLPQAAELALPPPRAGRSPARLPLPQLRGGDRRRDRRALPRRDRRGRPLPRARVHDRQRLRRARLPARRPRLDAAREGPGRLLPPRARARRRRRRRPRGPHHPHLGQRRARAGGPHG